MKDSKRKVILLDIDDVILDFIGTLCHAYNNQQQEVHIHPEDILDFQLNTAKGINLMQFFLAQERSSLIYREIPFLKDAETFLKGIEAAGLDLILITARGTEHRKTTEQSLKAAGVRYHSLFMYKNKAAIIEKLMDEYDIITYVDDAVHNLESVAKLEPNFPIFLMDRPANKGDNTFIRIESLTEIMDLLYT